MVKWISSTRLVVRWLNRAQNQSEICVCEATTGACSEKHTMVMDLMQNQRQEVPLFSSDGSWFYLTLPAKQGARGEFRHIASLPAQPAIPTVPPRFLTSGNWDVTVLCALDEDNGKIYFLSTEESRQSRHLYSADLEGIFQRQCLTCYLLDGCSFFKAEFSPNQKYFTLYCLGPGVPKVTVHSTKDPSRYIVLEDNTPLSEALHGKRLPETVFKTLTADNHDLHLKLSMPQRYEAKLLPLLIIVDGVPGSQSVTEEFAMGWPEVLASTHDVALAWVDGRSGVGWGQKISSVDPRKLSSLRVKDQLGVAFGGYLSLKMLAATNRLFKCAAAVAPITDFKLYTRVHFQHSAELLSRLVKVEANYSLQLYPDEGHTLREQRSIQHFQQTLVHYLQTCLRHNPLLASIEEPDEDEEDD
ncbi:unnamed protein product [Coregonus sp. 'balchen']|nr:unnamed protein product [Coregonus sp. 'balchen']